MQRPRRGENRLGAPPLWQTSSQWGSPKPPNDPAPTHFTVTIADLGSFPTEIYAAQLDLWCKSALTAWQTIS